MFEIFEDSGCFGAQVNDGVAVIAVWRDYLQKLESEFSVFEICLSICCSLLRLNDRAPSGAALHGKPRALTRDSLALA